jgi:hypothetical protein
MATDVKVLTLRYSPAKHEKLVDLKKKSGARSWEDFFLMLAGTELNKKNLPPRASSTKTRIETNGQCERCSKSWGDGQ